MANWSYQNAYRRKRYLEQTMQRSLVAEQIRLTAVPTVAKGEPGPTRQRFTCTAQVGATGKRCKNVPAAGSDVCRFHGGASPQVKRLAAIRHSLLKAKDVLSGHQVVLDPWTGSPMTLLKETLERATKKDPREVLLQQVHEAAAMAAATREFAGDIDQEALLDPEHAGHAKAKQTHELFLLWNERATKSSKMALDVGIDEAMIKLAELQAKAMVRALKGVIGADVLGLTPAQQKLAQALLGQALREMVPDVATTPTVTLQVGGENIPYNPAMDSYVDVSRPAKDRNTEYHSARRVQLRDQARLGSGTEEEATG